MSATVATEPQKVWLPASYAIERFLMEDLVPETERINFFFATAGDHPEDVWNARVVGNDVDATAYDDDPNALVLEINGKNYLIAPTEDEW